MNRSHVDHILRALEGTSNYSNSENVLPINEVTINEVTIKKENQMDRSHVRYILDLLKAHGANHPAEKKLAEVVRWNFGWLVREAQVSKHREEDLIREAYHLGALYEGGHCDDETIREIYNAVGEEVPPGEDNINGYVEDNINGYVEEILIWAKERCLLTHVHTHAQMLKMTEEVGELASAIARGKKEEVADAIGDCFVVLTILAKKLCLDIDYCIEKAVAEIRDRKGTVVDGVFIKEEK